MTNVNNLSLKNKARCKNNTLATYKVEIFIVIGGLIAINLILLAGAFREIDTINPQSAGFLGDFVGGYIGTLFSLLGILLLYATLKNQRQSSEQQNFELKYFELIRMHRENVGEISIGQSAGRRVFVLLIREFREILYELIELDNIHLQQITKIDLIGAAYYVLFYGTGPNSSRMLSNALNAHKEKFSQEFINVIVNRFESEEFKNEIKTKRKFGYLPFEGHQSRLGHYYRHLYQSVTYVDKQQIDIDKYECVKTIRAQLSTHEQALLLINSLTPLGKNWFEYGLLHKYHLVQNIPADFFDIDKEIDVFEYFGDMYFEWQKT